MKLKANGMDFQSHTASHKSMTELTEAQLKDETLQDLNKH